MGRLVSTYVSTTILFVLTLILTNGFIVSLDRMYRGIVSSLGSTAQCVGRTVVEKTGSYKYILIPCNDPSLTVIGEHQVLLNESDLIIIRAPLEERVVVILGDEFWYG